LTFLTTVPSERLLLPVNYADMKITARQSAALIMFSSELWSVLKQVVSSWQVIAVAVVIILYWSLVNAAAGLHKKPKTKTVAKNQKLKRLPKAPEPDKNLDAGGLGIGE
jgi:hypothetical protein